MSHSGFPILRRHSDTTLAPWYLPPPSCCNIVRLRWYFASLCLASITRVVPEQHMIHKNHDTHYCWAWIGYIRLSWSHDDDPSCDNQDVATYWDYRCQRQQKTWGRQWGKRKRTSLSLTIGSFRRNFWNTIECCVKMIFPFILVWKVGFCMCMRRKLRSHFI